jgi:gluconate 2-dehydrogenase gamma chain
MSRESAVGELSMDDDQNTGDPAGRRLFLRAGGGLLTGAWLAAHWPALVAAHAAMTPAGISAHPDTPPAAGDAPSFFTPAEAADVAAIAAQIVPSGATPGSHEAGAVHFIDRALATFFAAWGPDFRAGLRAFQVKFAAAGSGSAIPATAGATTRATVAAATATAGATTSFAAADPVVQAAFLTANDRTEFFESVRRLTLLGMFSAPKYGGNRDTAGWVLLGFHDEHIFAPPFGEYDAEYAGFVPYGQSAAQTGAQTGGRTGAQSGGQSDPKAGPS